MSIDRGYGIATSAVLADSYDLDALIADTEAAKVAAEAAQAAAETAQSAAETAETNAETAETNAAASASAAATSESNIAGSEAVCAASETAAAASASAAATSESNAATSETNAATSETNAATSETNAATSETNAASSASSASSSATSASSSASSASTSATAAASSASAASTSETNAAASATSASTSASTATTQASNASTSASAAATSASNASTSETNAATSATAAQTAQTAAETAQSAAEAAQEAIDGLYLGALSSNPTVDGNGDPVTTGDWYFNTTDNSTYIYNGSSWDTLAPDLVGDATPQLGGDLDLNSNNITGTGNIDVTGTIRNTNNQPTIRPSLLLDFANSKTLDPRIDFTRSSTATYYDGKTFAKAEENLIPDSSFAIGWDDATVSVTTGQSAPDGSTDAIKVTNVSDGRFFYNNVFGGSSASSGYQRSIYAKVASGTADTCILAHNTATGALVTLTDTWQRFDLEATNGQYLSNFYGVDFRHASNTATEVYLWAPQLEQRDSVTAYTPTTTQPITNYIPVLQTAASGEARFDHDPVTGESKGLLIEEQRTNLQVYSEEFDNGAWLKSQSSITANTIIAPDGTLTADKLVEDTNTNRHDVDDGFSMVDGTYYTLSCYAKAGEREGLSINAGGLGATFNLLNGNVNYTHPGSVGFAINFSASTVNVGNGWYRCIVSFEADLTVSTTIRICLTNSATHSDSSQQSYTGDGYSGAYIWGAQAEAGAFPTSYIPTSGSQVTRSADSASMTGTNFSDWYRQDEGSLYAEASTVSTSAAGKDLININDGSNNNYIQFNKTAYTNQTRARLYININGDNPVAIYNTAGTVSANTYNKQTASYKVNDFAFAFDGGLVGTDSIGTLPVVSQLNIGSIFSGSQALNGHIKKISYYPTRLTNAELVALTED